MSLINFSYHRSGKSPHCSNVPALVSPTLMVSLAAVVVCLLFASTTRAEHVGDCYDDKRCQGKLLSAIDGEALPNTDIVFKTGCNSFHSFVGAAYHADLCTQTACTKRLQFGLCYGQGGYKSIEFLPRPE